MLTSKAFIVYI